MHGIVQGSKQQPLNYTKKVVPDEPFYQSTLNKVNQDLSLFVF